MYIITHMNHIFSPISISASNSPTNPVSLRAILLIVCINVFSRHPEVTEFINGETTHFYEEKSGKVNLFILELFLPTHVYFYVSCVIRSEPFPFYGKTRHKNSSVILQRHLNSPHNSLWSDWLWIQCSQKPQKLQYTCAFCFDVRIVRYIRLQCVSNRTWFTTALSKVALRERIVADLVCPNKIFWHVKIPA